MISNFNTSLDLILKSEGGFNDNPKDPGNILADGRNGCTNFGITQQNWENYLGHKVSIVDMKALSIESISKFYKIKYWDACNCDELPIGIDYMTFDFAINTGVGRSSKVLQSACGVIVDGSIGPNTINAINNMNITTLIDKFSELKTIFYKSLITFSIFGKGWLNRVNEVKINANHMF